MDVNRYIHLHNKAGSQTINPDDDVVRCNSSRKREVLDYQLLVDALDTQTIQDNLEAWRREKFDSLEWTEEAREHLAGALDHLTKVSNSLQNINFDQLAAASREDPLLLQLVLSSQANVILTSLTAAVNQSQYFFKNSQVWDNYTSMIQSLGEYFLTFY